MRITFDANPMMQQNKSGIGYFSESLLNELIKNSPSETIITAHYFNFLNLTKNKHRSSSKKMQYKTTVYFPTKILNIFRRFNIIFPIELFTRKKADVTIFTNFIALPTLLGGKKVSIIYDTSYIDCPQFAPTRLTKYLKRWVSYSVKSSDLVIVNSVFTKNRIIGLYKKNSESIIVLPIPAIPHPSMQIMPSTISKERKKYILFVGTIEPRKNIINLVMGYSLLDKSLSDEYCLVLAGGKGWKDEIILDTVRELQAKGLNIIMTGYVSDEEKSYLYHNASLCIQPSLYEGFGMPILEAMSYAKPIICSDIEVFREVAGSAALYVDPYKPELIAQGIRSVLSDERIRNDLIRRSRERTSTYPSWEQVGKEFYQAISKL